ncbi:MAG TPA: ABC transporter permease [Candidatus Dormibacteraeota bacterium]|nr:ABC transporter permease [Candidatus Dormibacteraeota bacterium]
MKILEAAGSSVIREFTYIGGLTMQSWSSLRASVRVLPIVGKRSRWRATMSQIVAIGTRGLPMIATLSACVGLILSIQTAAELNRFGAIQLVINILAVGFTRELGPLVTAIVVSGRSGSAFSAEIGTMVATNEIDALRTMAIDPIEVVVTPKYLAAIIAVPCLTIMSDFFGIMAGAGFMYLSTDMTLGIYLTHVFDSILLRDVLLGLLKSAAFATIIAQVGCMEGLKVRGGPEAVGRSTTSAVVRSTFLVILADLLFTAAFYLTGVE